MLIHMRDNAVTDCLGKLRPIIRMDAIQIRLDWETALRFFRIDAEKVCKSAIGLKDIFRDIPGEEASVRRIAGGPLAREQNLIDRTHGTSQFYPKGQIRMP
ncbi:hypothetical protein ACRQ1B_17895 [Rhizobium panacihumi]|uniref:hypothetical protein n=1 Tax=Rhizobium panacihumi TaxID=2008450 RepID=UPI003D78D676